MQNLTVKYEDTRGKNITKYFKFAHIFIETYIKNQTYITSKFNELYVKDIVLQLHILFKTITYLFFFKFRLAET